MNKVVWMWEVVSAAKATLLAALAEVAADEGWTFDEFTRAAAPFFVEPPVGEGGVVGEDLEGADAAGQVSP